MPYFLINSPTDSKPRTVRRRRKASTRRKSMAARRRRRRANPRRRRHVARKNVVRRRRRRAVVHHFAANPPRRRRRRHRVNAHHRRRRGHRRNPFTLSQGRGLLGQVKQGLVDGVAVVGGQVACRKLATGVSAMLPAATGTTAQVQYVGMRLAAATLIGVLAKKFTPSHARMVTAGAFAEAVNAAVAQTPIAPYLSAIPKRRVLGTRALPTGFPAGVAAWPNRRVAAGVSAWPGRKPALPTMVGQ